MTNDIIIYMGKPFYVSLILNLVFFGIGAIILTDVIFGDGNTPLENILIYTYLIAFMIGYLKGATIAYLVQFFCFFFSFLIIWFFLKLLKEKLGKLQNHKERRR